MNYSAQSEAIILASYQGIDTNLVRLRELASEINGLGLSSGVAQTVDQFKPKLNELLQSAAGTLCNIRNLAEALAVMKSLGHSEMIEKLQYEHVKSIWRDMEAVISVPMSHMANVISDAKMSSWKEWDSEHWRRYKVEALQNLVELTSAVQ